MNSPNTMPCLEVRDISKTFGGVRALQGVSFTVAAGEVVGLAGENGAGKSTLKNIVGGTLEPDSGQVLLDDKPLQGGVAAAQGSGVATIHQEISLFPDLTVAENVLINRLGRTGVVHTSENNARARELLARVGATFEPTRLVTTLSTGESQLVEIAKALTTNPRFVVFDEPTASLTLSERAHVLNLVRQLAADGVGIIYISHYLEEMFEVCDTIVVLRDGQVVRTSPSPSITRSELEQAMVGRALAGGYPPLEPPSDEVLLQVDNLGSPAGVEGVSFEVHRGEILGLAGLMGSGRTEVARAIFGLDARTGEVMLEGAPLPVGSPSASIRHGMGFVTENRRDEGLFMERPIRENLSLPSLQRFLRLGFLLKRDERQSAQDEADRVTVRAKGGLEAVAGSLSGGNQQKVVIGKWLMTAPTFLILDEPTRGIDVGAKAEIYQLLRGIAATGVGILLISSEMEEVMGMSHRVGVMKDGHLRGIVESSLATQEELISLATGSN